MSLNMTFMIDTALSQCGQHLTLQQGPSMLPHTHMSHLLAGIQLLLKLGTLSCRDSVPRAAALDLTLLKSVFAVCASASTEVFCAVTSASSQLPCCVPAAVHT